MFYRLFSCFVLKKRCDLESSFLLTDVMLMYCAHFVRGVKNTIVNTVRSNICYFTCRVKADIFVSRILGRGVTRERMEAPFFKVTCRKSRRTQQLFTKKYHIFLVSSFYADLVIWLIGDSACVDTSVVCNTSMAKN